MITTVLIGDLCDPLQQNSFSLFVLYQLGNRWQLWTVPCTVIWWASQFTAMCLLSSLWQWQYLGVKVIQWRIEKEV